MRDGFLPDSCRNCANSDHKYTAGTRFLVCLIRKDAKGEPKGVRENGYCHDHDRRVKK